MKRHGIRLVSLALCAALVTALLPPALAWKRTGEYREGLALASDGERYGYVNVAGSLVIPLRFTAAGDFDLGVALVTENGKQGLLRQDGTFLLQPVYDSLESIGYGLYIGRQGDAWKLLSATPVPEDSRESGVTDTHQIYADAASIAVETGESGRELVLRWAGGGEETRIALTSLPRLLQEKGVPGWAFPLRPGRRARFNDVSERDWFDIWVDIAYNTGLMEGRSAGYFRPYGNLKVSEALKLVAIMDAQAAGRSIPAPRSGQPWYDGYLRYCEQQGIFQASELGESYERAITRAELALLISRTELFYTSEDINDRDWIERSIPDVGSGDFAASAIFGLYAKGIITGSDSRLTFRPDAVITRAEVAAIVARMVRPEQRVVLQQTDGPLRVEAAEEAPAEE